jgi:sugar phosphate permease
MLWTAYAGYYLCRLNFSVAQPEILKEFPAWTATKIGMIPSTYAFFYAAGQLINGVLCQKFGARIMMTVAMGIAAITNVLFAFASSFEMMLGLWAINGYAQSAGWALVTQTIANWTTSRRRGTVMGLIASCYTVGNVLAWLLAGQLCATAGWRAAFWVPGVILLPIAAAFHMFVRNRPEDVGLPPARDDLTSGGDRAGNQAAASADDLGMAEILRLTFTNRILWILAIGFFCMNAVRYSFMNWTVQYMADFHGRSIKGSALVAVVIPLLGVPGALFAGWASDAWFGRRRAPVCVLMQVALAGVCLGFTVVPAGSWGTAAILLGTAGFLIYGPDLLMSGAATIDVSHPRAASIATGFTMCLGALGAIFSGAGVGMLKDLAKGNWNLMFQVLAGLVLLSSLFMVSIWNTRPHGTAK